MKKIFASICLIIASVLAYSQAHDGTVEYQKQQLAAAVIELPYTPDIVTASLNDYLSRKGKSVKQEIKGFVTYRNTQVSQNEEINADLYFKIERKSRKEKEVTVVSLLLTYPDEGPKASPGLNHLNMQEAKTFLNELVPAIEAYNLELSINEQNDAVIKAESKLKSLEEDGKDLEKKRSGIEKKITENNNDQEAQKREIENQKQKLASWVNQRKA